MFLVDSWEASRPVVFYGSKSGLIGDVIVWFTSVLRLCELVLTNIVIFGIRA